MKIELLQKLHFTVIEAIQTLAAAASRTPNYPLSAEQKIRLSDLFVTSWKITDLLNCLGFIKLHCTHALNGTCPEDRNLQDYDPYFEALHRFGDQRRFDTIHLPADVVHLMKVFPELQRRKGELLLFFSGELTDFRVKEDWTFEKKTPEELAKEVNDDYLMSLEASFVASNWSLDLTLAKELIESRGDLKTAINLVS
jgi:hypothetical protein